MSGLERRLLSKVVVDENSCWIWTGCTDRYGYGKISVAGRKLKAHRVSYELHVADIEAGKVLDHLCRVRSCVNPFHLEPVSTQENTRRGIAARQSGDSI